MIELSKKYDQIEEISRGGMGVVYKARQRDLDRTVAIKLMLGPLTAESYSRFRKEAQALALLSHEGIIRVMDFGQLHGTPYLVMEYVEGQDLHAMVRDHEERHGRLPGVDWVADRFLDLVEVLEHCHSNKVIHRDLKPRNVLICEGGESLRLADFGLVKFLSSRSPDGISKSGAVIGTPEYIAPEQIDKSGFGKPDRATDVWGLGATLYFCLTGHPPFARKTVFNIYNAVLRGDLPKVKDHVATVPDWMSDLCEDCLQRDMALRPTLAEIAEALTVRGRKPFPVGKLVKLSAILLSVLVLVLVVIFASRDVEAPHLSFDKGLPKTTFSEQLLVTGTFDEPGCILTINGRGVQVKATHFRARLPMSKGDNLIKFRFQDQAGNHRSLVHVVQRVTSVAVGPGADFETIAEALAEVEPGLTIDVHKGNYTEPLSIRTEVRIRGHEGAIINANVSVSAKKVILERLTIAPPSAGLSGKPALDIRSGRALVREVRIVTGAGPGLRVKGKDAKPRIVNCDIRSTVDPSVLFDSRAGGRLEKCRIREGVGACVRVQNGAKPVIVGCEILDSDAYGVEFTKRAAGVLRDCKIHRIRNFGVMVSVEADPVIEGCRIIGTSRSALSFMDLGRGQAIDCRLEGCLGTGLFVSNGRPRKLAKLTISGSGGHGVYFIRAKDVALEDSVLSNSKMVGVFLEECVSIKLDLVIAKGQSEGLKAEKTKNLTVFDSAFSGNQKDGMVFDNSTATVWRSRVQSSGDDGIVVEEESELTLENCRILESGLLHKATGEWTADVLVRESRLTARKTVFAFNAQYGVRLVKGARARLSKCQFKRHISYSLMAEDSSSMNLEACEFSKNHLPLLLLRGQARASITGSKIVGRGTWWKLAKGARLVESGNEQSDE